MNNSLHDCARDYLKQIRKERGKDYEKPQVELVTRRTTPAIKEPESKDEQSIWKRPISEFWR